MYNISEPYICEKFISLLCRKTFLNFFQVQIQFKNIQNYIKLNPKHRINDKSV
jgi:hypothetical protein